MLLLEEIHHLDKITRIPMDTVHFKDQDGIPGIDLLQHLPVCRAFGVTSGITVVGIDVGDLIIVYHAVVFERLPLSTQRETFFSLFLRRYPKIQSNPDTGHDMMNSGFTALYFSCETIGMTFSSLNTSSSAFQLLWPT